MSTRDPTPTAAAASDSGSAMTATKEEGLRDLFARGTRQVHRKHRTTSGGRTKETTNTTASTRTTRPVASKTKKEDEDEKEDEKDWNIVVTVVPQQAPSSSSTNATLLTTSQIPAIPCMVHDRTESMPALLVGSSFHHQEQQTDIPNHYNAGLNSHFPLSHSYHRQRKKPRTSNFSDVSYSWIRGASSEAPSNKIPEFPVEPFWLRITSCIVSTVHTHVSPSNHNSLLFVTSGTILVRPPHSNLHTRPLSSSAGSNPHTAPTQVRRITALRTIRKYSTPKPDPPTARSPPMPKHSSHPSPARPYPLRGKVGVSLSLSPPHSLGNTAVSTTPKYYGSIIAHFLDEWAPHLSPEALAGSLAWNFKEDRRNPETNNTLSTTAQQDATYKAASMVGQFLAHHRAIHTLCSHSSSTTTSNGNDDPWAGGTASRNAISQRRNMMGGNTMEYYMSALKEFQTSQLDRQKASLTSNSGREDAERATLIESQYIKALHQALGTTATTNDVARTASSTRTSSLSQSTLCAWHSILCGQGIHAEAGQLRTKLVRVGPVHFCPSAKVPEYLDRVCSRLHTVERRLLWPHSTTANTTVPSSTPTTGSTIHNGNRLATSTPVLFEANNHNHLQEEDQETQWRRVGLSVATYAALVFFGVVDIHGFVDGNGRLARIALNWALQRAGFPFVIHLFATPAQRNEYTQAIGHTRRNLSLEAVTCSTTTRTQSSTVIDTPNQATTNQEAMILCLELAGAMGPLVTLILDRMGKAIVEFEKVVEEKSRLVTEQAEAKAAKKIRDRERAGTCLICFEDHPNIATLCCGKAVHLNCVAQWISTNATCPNCREPFPALPPRLQRPAARNNNPSQEQEFESTQVEHRYYSDDDLGFPPETWTTSTTVASPDPADEEDDDDDVEGLLPPSTSTVVEEDTEIQAEPEADNDTSFTTTTVHDDEVEEPVEDDTTTSMLPPEAEVAALAENAPDDTTTTVFPPEDTTTVHSTTEEDAAEGTEEGGEDTTTMGASDHSTSSEVDTDAYVPSDSTTMLSGYNAPPPPPICSMRRCRNRAARDCANSCCGRCCLLHGRFSCMRHNQL